MWYNNTTIAKIMEESDKMVTIMNGYENIDQNIVSNLGTRNNYMTRLKSGVKTEQIECKKVVILPEDHE